MKPEIPAMYLFIYCKLRNKSNSLVIKRADALKWIGYHVPHPLRQHILREMEDYALVEQINQRELRIKKMGVKFMEKFGIEIIEG